MIGKPSAIRKVERASILISDKDISALSSATLLHNYYDPSGEKVGKATIYGSNTSAYNIYTWYVRDVPPTAGAM